MESPGDPIASKPSEARSVASFGTDVSAKLLYAVRVIQSLGLAGDDWFVGDSFISVAVQNEVEFFLVTDGNRDSRPTVVNLPLDQKL